MLLLKSIALIQLAIKVGTKQTLLLKTMMLQQHMNWEIAEHFTLSSWQNIAMTQDVNNLAFSKSIFGKALGDAAWNT